MDFIARAGSYIDRAHRIAGVLLICVALLAVLSMCQLGKNAVLNAELNNQRVALPVIVVPGAVSGKYDPRDEDKLIDSFSFFITQTFNTYTQETLEKQYETAKTFFAPALLTDSSPYFEKKIRDVKADKRSSLFIPDQSTLQVKKYQVNGAELRDVTLTGTLQTIVAGTPAEVVPLEIGFTLQKTLVNPAVNPYGFVMTSYHEKPLIDANARPELLDANTPEQPSPPAAPNVVPGVSPGAANPQQGM